MLGGISIPTKIVLEFYPDLPSHSAKVWSCAKGVSVIYHWILRHAGKGMVMCQKCFSQLPLPTETCQEGVSMPTKIVLEIYPDLPRHADKVWACTKSVSVMYHSLLRHAGGVSMPTEIFSAIYGDLPRQAGKSMGMCRKCFGNLLFPTEAWQEVYTHH